MYTSALYGGIFEILKVTEPLIKAVREMIWICLD